MRLAGCDGSGNGSVNKLQTPSQRLLIRLISFEGVLPDRGPASSERLLQIQYAVAHSLTIDSEHWCLCNSDTIIIGGSSYSGEAQKEAEHSNH